MSQQAPGPYARGFRLAVDGMKLAFRSEEVGRAYLKVAAVIFVLTLAIDVGGIWGLIAATAVPEDAAVWLVAALWAGRIVGSLAILLIGPLLAVFLVNIAFPLFNQAVFMAGLRAIDPERAAALEAKPGMPLRRSIAISLWRLVKFLGLSVALFVLGLVPVLGSVVAWVLQLWLTTRTVAWELLDPYFESLDIRYAEQREFVARHKKPLLGFGFPVALLLAIPVVGPLAFGLAQAAAANFVARELPVDSREAA